MAGPVLVTTAGDKPPPEPEPARDAPPGSLLAALQAEAAALKADAHLDVPIGGKLPNVVVRYGYLAESDMDRYGELAPGRIGATSLTKDMLVSACRTVFYRHDGGMHDLEAGLNGRLWQMLGQPLPRGIERAEDMSPIDVVFELFDRNPMALVTHAERVITWMQDPVSDPGEGSAATT